MTQQCAAKKKKNTQKKQTQKTADMNLYPGLSFTNHIILDKLFNSVKT